MYESNFVRLTVLNSEPMLPEYLNQQVNITFQVLYIDYTTGDSFSEEHGSMYMWPGTPDEDWELLQNIKEKLKEPSLSEKSTHRRNCFVFK